MLKIVDNSSRSVDFKAIKIGRCFKGRASSEWIYLRIQVTRDGMNAINLTNGDLCKFHDEAAVFPLEAELTVR